jgi:DNA-binding CsgD family transcriptional regulator
VHATTEIRAAERYGQIRLTVEEWLIYVDGRVNGTSLAEFQPRLSRHFKLRAQLEHLQRGTRQRPSPPAPCPGRPLALPVPCRLRRVASARARGRVGGRPPSMTPTKIAIARQMYDAQQHSFAEIARTLGVSRASIYRHLAHNPTADCILPLRVRPANTRKVLDCASQLGKLAKPAASNRQGSGARASKT